MACLASGRVRKFRPIEERLVCRFFSPRVVRRTRPVTDLIEISPPGGLPRSAEGIEVVEGRVAGFGVGAGLQEGTLEISKSRRMRSGMGQLLVGPSA